MAFVGIIPRREGQPWDAQDDARLLEDRDYGLDVHMMAMRATRTHAEVEQRLAELAPLHPPRPRAPVKSKRWR